MRIHETSLENTWMNGFIKIINPEKKMGEKESCLKSNSEAEYFWALVVPHKHKLYNFIQKSLSFSPEADDVFQETLLRSLKYFSSYNEKKSFSTWLFTIANNEIKRYYKKAHRHFSLTESEKSPIPDKGVNHDLIREIYQLADNLKPKKRQIFFLFYDSGFTMSEISIITGLKEGNIKFLLNRIRHSLRKHFGEQNEQ